MVITDVRIRKIDGQSRLRAIASITIDNAFAVHELRVIEGMVDYLLLCLVEEHMKVFLETLHINQH